MSAPIPHTRIQFCNDAAINPQGKFVLYWMIASRRPGWNFALQQAVNQALALDKPLVILEALRINYPWASDRFHRFVMDGMCDHIQHFKHYPVCYYPYVERRIGEGRGLLSTLAVEACLIVTDDFPCFFLPRMVQAAAKKLGVQLQAVDSNGLLPMRAAKDTFKTAYSFRRFLQNNLHTHLAVFPQSNPLEGIRLPRFNMPEVITQRWPCIDKDALKRDTGLQSQLDINHAVAHSEGIGGFSAGLQRVRTFLDSKLNAYEEHHNHPDKEASSHLSPWLHFGHVSSHFIFAEIAGNAGWSLEQAHTRGNGSKRGWWKLPSSTEAFLDELVTWRELGFNMCATTPDYDQYESLPQWAKSTLAQHGSDKRAHLYTLNEFEAAQTHDPVWNAAQRQLIVDGYIHNYMRMLWGKKIVEWSTSPELALSIMLELNNKYALDGRDPNSYSGIFWVLGRYDRPWGPERPIFGKVRYMSSASTLRKLRLKEYLHRYRG